MCVDCTFERDVQNEQQNGEREKNGGRKSKKKMVEATALDSITHSVFVLHFMSLLNNIISFAYQR